MDVCGKKIVMSYTLDFQYAMYVSVAINKMYPIDFELWITFIMQYEYSET